MSELVTELFNVVLQASLEQEAPITAITGVAMLSQIAEQEAARRQEDDNAMLQ